MIKTDAKTNLILWLYSLLAISLLVIVMCYAAYFRLVSVLNGVGAVYMALLSQPMPTGKPDGKNEALKGTVREITAYNVGVVAQNDQSPCIGATGSDLCEELAQGNQICAANFVPLETVIYIEGWGKCVVRDRMNSRYQNRVDIAFPADQIAEALQFGKQNLLVKN